MIQKEKTTLILIDAFRHNYICKNKTPFIYKLSKKNTFINKIVPGNGFCERAEIFTGKSQEKTGYFSAYKFSKNKNCYTKIKYILIIFHIILKSIRLNILNKVIRRVLWEYSKRTRNPIHPQNIPLNLLEKVHLTEDFNDMYLTDALNHTTIFDILNKDEKTIFHKSFTSLRDIRGLSDSERLKLFIKNIKNNYDFYLLYISKLDSIGHKYGPNSIELSNSLTEVDNTIKNIYNKILDANEINNIIILGDHGMVPVFKNIDISVLLKNLKKKFNLKEKKDYIFFIDSTFFRICFFNPTKHKKAICYLSSNELLSNNGIILTEELCKQYKVPYLTEEYGNFIWWANPGIQLFPNFFTQSTPPKGMHGYTNSDDNSKGFSIICNGTNKTFKEMKLTGVFKYLKYFINK